MGLFMLISVYCIQFVTGFKMGLEKSLGCGSAGVTDRFAGTFFLGRFTG